MANPAVTYVFANSTTADASQVNQNFTDLINGLTDGTKSLTIDAITAGGTATFNGNTTVGNASSDTLTVTARVASHLIPSADATYALGASTPLTWTALYLDNGVTDGGAVYFNAGTTAFLKADASGADLDVGGFTGLDLKSAEIKRMSLYDEAKSADYPITDTDGVSVIYMTTSSTDRVVTLPTVADNAGRVITVKKVDSGTGVCTVDGEGSETIDGAANVVLAGLDESVTVQSTGAAWHIIARKNEPKVYQHGTTYNGGNAPTLTLTAGGGTLDTVALAHFTPYQVQGGGWRLRFSVAVVLSSATRTTATLNVAGVTTFNASQAIVAGPIALVVAQSIGRMGASSGDIIFLYSSSTTTSHAASGDVALASKPTWAY